MCGRAHVCARGRVSARVINSLKHPIFLVFDGFEILHSRIFGVADYESELRIQKFKVAHPIWRKKLKKLLDSGNIWYSGVFGVFDYESELMNHKFIMAGLIWQTKIK